MASPVWKSYAARPLGIGGAAQFCGWAHHGSEDPADKVLAVAALAAPTGVSWGDQTAVQVDLPLGKNGLTFRQGLAAGPLVASFFAQTAAGWQAGPAVALDLAPTWVAEFDSPKPWAIDTLKEIEADSHPLGLDTRLEVRGSYPRDDIPLPCLSVQFEASPQAQKLLGNLAQSLAVQTEEQRIPWDVSLTMQVWCETPEDREMLAPWFGSAMQVLSYLAPFGNLSEPGYQFQESEDFSRQFMEKPIFLITGTLTGIVWSKLTLPARNWVGHLTV
jgi:hypothetical protein